MHQSWYFLDPLLWQSPLMLLILTGSFFLVIMIRYVLLSAAYHFIASAIFRRSQRNFSGSTPRQWKREIAWSALSALVFTLLTIITFFLYQKGYTKIYTDPDKFSIAYFLLSIIILLAGYETYYYWLHRWMHKPKVFRIIHKVHHDSIHTSVYTSFSFHPLEAFLQFIFLPVFVMVIPVHYCAIGIVLMVMTISAIINHGSIEIFPRSFVKSKIGKWLIGATHHDLHHKEFRTNYGLYFTFWDNWMNTESKNYMNRLMETTRKEEKGAD